MTTNWSGVAMGMSLALALFGGGVAGFARHPRAAITGLAAAMLGIAGVMMALGNGYLAIVVAAVLGAGVPTLLLLALAATPSTDADFRPGPGTTLPIVVSVVCAVLALAVARARWTPSGAASQNTVEWIGSRFLTDHLVTLDLVAALLGIAACGAVALLRGRGARRS